LGALAAIEQKTIMPVEDYVPGKTSRDRRSGRRGAQENNFEHMISA
jgi:hypothetical protein